MKIREILNEITKPSKQETFSKLISAGYKEIGKGYYANVFYKENKSYVLKLFSNKDRAYINFVSFCLKNKSPHLPKFKGKLIKINSEYSAIRMELLSPIIVDENTTNDIQCIALLHRFYNGENSYLAPDVNIWAEKHKTINDILQKLGSNLNKHCDDIHFSNVMMRGNTYVLIDPIG
jgi:hypothetical protein